MRFVEAHGFMLVLSLLTDEGAEIYVRQNGLSARNTYYRLCSYDIIISYHTIFIQKHNLSFKLQCFEHFVPLVMRLSIFGNYGVFF